MALLSCMSQPCEVTDMRQISIFDGSSQFKCNKPIRLISLFSGYDSQALALKYLNIPFEHWKTCEWAIKSIQALKDLHFKTDNIDYSQKMQTSEIINYLFQKGISADYNQPLKIEQIKRLGDTKLRAIYNNIQATHNMVNIQQVQAADLEIVDADKYTYLITYSFPCQDLSKAGKGKGMAKGDGTRSGMLWEVERILDECSKINTLPQVLLMENVPDVVSSKNIKHFAKWLDRLESFGYKSYKQILNAKNYGIPQNRERCYMVSILGDYFYTFPPPIKLTNLLSDLLEDNVDEKYYLTKKAIIGGLKTNFCSSKLENKLPKNGVCPTIMARDYKDPKCVVVGLLDIKGHDLIKRIYSPNGLSPTITTCGGGNTEPKIIDDTFGFEREPRIYENVSPTIRASRNGLKVAEPLADKYLKTKNIRLKSMLNKIDLSKTQAIDMYNQSTHDTMHTIKANIDKSNMTAVTQNFRIRKLTPKECFRLMGVKDEDYELIAKNQSNASLYHLAGDSIVVNVLMAIFKNLFMFGGKL